MLEGYGYTMRAPHGGSSHRTFVKAGHAPITIPRHKTVKLVYVEKAKEVIENEEEDSDGQD